MTEHQFNSVKINGKTYTVYTSKDSFGNTTSSVDGDFSTPSKNSFTSSESSSSGGGYSGSSLLYLPLITVLGGMIILGGIILGLILVFSH